MGRKRTGTLVWTGAAYSVRFANGPLIPLHTDDKRIAAARQRAVASNPESAPTSATETFEEAARRHVNVQLVAKVPSAPARLSRLERWALPTLGPMLVTAVRPGHISAVLEHVAGLGKSTTTLAHMRGDLIYVFGRLLKEEAVTRNPARGDLVDTPPGSDDERKRVILRDEEFTALVQAPTTPAQLRLMAIVSRTFGGMRTSDLRAWAWTHLDLSGAWAWADVPRPKTTKKARRGARGATHALERLALPPTVAAELATWWEATGRPVEGSVFRFPAARKSYAADLRAALLAAGIDRHELHHDTDRSRRVDFHSFRRAWATAIAGAGLNAQSAMQLTGHRQMATHMLYVVPELRQIPTAALPTWAVPTSGLSERPPGVSQPSVAKCADSLSYEGQESNLQAIAGASTSIQSEHNRNVPETTHLGSQLHDTTWDIQPVPYGNDLEGPTWGNRVVDSKLSIRSVASDHAVRSYLRALATSIAGLLNAHGITSGRGVGNGITRSPITPDQITLDPIIGYGITKAPISAHRITAGSDQGPRPYIGPGHPTVEPPHTT